MELNYYHPFDGITTEYMFNFKGLKLNCIDDFNSNQIDFIPFDGVRVSSLQDKNQIKDFVHEVKINGSFQKALEDNKLPIVFYHEHETLDTISYMTFLKIVSETLNVDKKKIILLDSNLLEKDGTINSPFDLKIKQFKIKVKDSTFEKNTKFAFLNNRSRKLRVQILDKILKNYENDINLLKKDNIVTFRNFKENENLKIKKGPSNDISCINDFILESKYYKFYNNYDFYKSIGLPWVIDDFTVGHEYNKMYEKQNIIYSTSCFSIVTETENRWLNLDTNRNEIGYLPLTEKAIVPISCGNLPFIVHESNYYNRLEEGGFDFSYLKELFGINYKTNTLRENFDSLDKFVSYFKNNQLKQVIKDYESFEDLIESNKKVLKDIQENTYSKSISEFVDKIKKEKYE